MFVNITEDLRCQTAKLPEAVRQLSSETDGRQAEVCKSLHAPGSTTVCWMCLSFVTSPRRRCSLRRESCNSFHRMASTSLIGKLRGPRPIPKRTFRSVWMVSLCSFRVCDTKRFRGRFSLSLRRLVLYYQHP